MIHTMAFAALAAAALLSAQETVTYEGAEEDFPNPERGFYIQRSYNPPDSVAPLATRLRPRSAGISLVRLYWVLSEYRDAALDERILARVAADFDAARREGLKVIPRFAYNFGPIGVPDAPLDRILGHLDQLRPIIEANADVIAFVEAGFIGTWGEWHNSTNGHFEPIPGRWWQRVNDNSRAVVAKLHEVLPASRMIALRYPRHKMDLFGAGPLQLAEAFGGSPKARTGAHNDCFLASSNDRGTYTANAAAEKEFYTRDNAYVPQGGETCTPAAGAEQFYRCGNALKELAAMRYTTLNQDYHRAVLGAWEEDGCMGEIRRRLGYRLRLTESAFPVAARPGGPVRLRFQVANDGWGALYNPRRVYLAIRHRASGELWRAALCEDPRFWPPGDTRSVDFEAGLPPSAPAGEYDVLLHLPDESARLAGLPAYAVRLANPGVWEERTGMNRLNHTLRVGEEPAQDVYRGTIWLQPRAAAAERR